MTRAQGTPGDNVALVAASAIVGVFLWWWWTFSGPFRWLVDRELALFGAYWEPATGFVLGIPVALLAWCVWAAVRSALPATAPWVANTVTAAVLLVVSAGAVTTAWQMWRDAAHLPDVRDPARTVDLGRIDGAPVPTGHVRLIGVALRARQVLVDHVGRHGIGGHWEAWAPVVARHWPAAPGAVRIVAVRAAADEATAATGVPDDPDGVMLADGIDTRTIYDLRSRGLKLVDHPFVLFWPGRDVGDDGRMDAAILAALVALGWGFVLFAWLAGRDFGATARPAAAAPDVPVAIAPPPPARPRQKASGAERIVFAVALAAILAAFALYEMAWFLPARFVLPGVAGAAVLVLAGGLAMALSPDRAAPPARAAAPRASALLYVIRDRPINALLAARVELDGVRVVLGAERYAALPLAPGPHRLVIGTHLPFARKATLRVEAAAGETLAFRIDLPLLGRARVERMPDLLRAHAAIARLKPVPAGPAGPAGPGR